MSPAKKTSETAPSVPTPMESEFMRSISLLNENIGMLNETLILIREHEFVEFHKSKWKIFAYQIFLGILFAVGTVLGLVLLSWTTYTFFKDSEILRGIVDNQLKMRNFNLQDIRDKAKTDYNSTKTGTASNQAAAQ